MRSRVKGGRRCTWPTEAIIRQWCSCCWPPERIPLDWTERESPLSVRIVRGPRRSPSNLQTLNGFEGLYDLGDGFTVKVWREGDRLRIREFAPDDLVPIGGDTFFCRQEPWQVRFNRTEAGDVDGVEIRFLRRTVHGARTPSPRYLGSQACMECHQTQHVTWLQSRHAHAYWRLGADWALFLGRTRPHYQDLEDPMSDQRCTLCHVTGAQDDNALYAGSFRPGEGVSCESCHGPGSNYIDPEIMADRDAFLANGGRVPDEATCRSCHRRSENFDWATWSPKIAHPIPRPEPSTSTSLLQSQESRGFANERTRK